MIFLRYLLLLLFGLLIIIFYLPIKLQVQINNDEKYIILKILFFKMRFDLNSAGESAEKPKEKKEAAKSVKAKPSSIKEKKKKRVLSKQQFKKIYRLLLPIPKVLRYAVRGIHMNDVRIFLNISSDDAAQTGQLYAKICTFFFPLLRILQMCFHMKLKQVKLTPDFYHTTTRYDLYFTVKFRIYRAVFTGALYLWHIVKELVKNSWFKTKVTSTE